MLFIMVAMEHASLICDHVSLLMEEYLGDSTHSVTSEMPVFIFNYLLCKSE